MIRVVNVKGLRTPEQRAGVIYCGRPFAGWKGHPLGNPFRPRDGDTVGTCLAKYRAWLLARPTLDADLAALWEQTRHGELSLGCWCCFWDGESHPAPPCHAVIISQLLQEWVQSQQVA